jgi:endonuclease I
VEIGIGSIASARAISAPITIAGGAPPPAAPDATERVGAAAIAAYYAPAQGKQGVALLRSLHDIVESTHEVRSYANARSMMFRVVEDLDGDDVVVDLYSGQKVPDVSGLRSATKAGLTTEHVWPQSEGATEAAKSDMHHLRPAFQSLNSHRSNLPYGEVKNPDWANDAVKGVDELSMVGTDESGTKVFTPRASMRGDLARDQFYFFTRYHGDRPEGYSTGNFLHSLDTLLKWHKDDPVDDAERARNDAIFHLQGNRNPYVDNPKFVDDVGFSERLVKRKPITRATGGS